ncbi:unnamed protein product, partial [Gulo gulo]
WEAHFLLRPSPRPPHPSSPSPLAENLPSHFSEKTEALEGKPLFSAPANPPTSLTTPHVPPSCAHGHRLPGSQTQAAVQQGLQAKVVPLEV